MSQKRKKNRRSQPSKTSPKSISPQTGNPPSSEMNGNKRITEISGADSHESAPRQLDDPPSSEMNGNERIIQISELTFRQQTVLPILAVSRSIAQAARDSGVAESTLRRWLHEPDFREELDRLRKESHSLVRSQVQAALPLWVSGIAEIAAESQDPALRFRAYRFLTDYATKLTELDHLHDELKNLKEALSSVTGDP